MQMSSDIVDLAAALKRLGGNEELLCTLVQFFLEDSPGLLSQVREGAVRRDATVIGLASHKLAGLSSNFGAGRAVAAARRLEELANACNWPEIPVALKALEQEVSLVTQALANESRRR
jgi:two-component system sensor histidine kinase/response regulator